jgi:hypothetical protein
LSSTLTVAPAVAALAAAKPVMLDTAVMAFQGWGSAAGSSRVASNVTSIRLIETLSSTGPI